MTIHKNRCLFLIIIIFFYLCINYNHNYDNDVEHMININYTPTSWNRNKCNYKLNDTFVNELKNHNIKQNNDWNLMFPCLYDNPTKEINEMNIKKNAKYFIIENPDVMVAKEKLWLYVVKHHGYDKACSLMPKGYILYDNNDISRFNDEYDSNKIYILKKNIQRQAGLKITNDKNEILNGKSQKFVIVQELLQNPYILNGRKINLRCYVLTVCYKGELNVYVYDNGFMYYTPNLFKKGSLEKDDNITTGYIDRQVYIDNPLTHEDFKKYLDDPNRKLTMIEQNLRNQNLKLSQIVFKRINDLIKDIFLSFIGIICSGKKLHNNLSFMLFGCDVAIDDTLHSMMIEINKGPSLVPFDERDSKLKHKISRDILQLIGSIDKGDLKEKNGFNIILEAKNGELLE